MSLATHLINSLVENFLPRGTENKVLVFELSNPTRDYHLEFYRPSNYTKVIARQIVGREHGEVIYGETVLYSDHDSCWRSDGTECFLEDTQCETIDSLRPFKIKEVNPNEYQNFVRSLHISNLSYTEEDMSSDFNSQEDEEIYLYDEE